MRELHFRYEIISKIIAKLSGVLKQLAILLFIGISLDLDAFYVASSYIGIVLALVSWAEIIILPVLLSKKSQLEKRKLLSASVQYILSCSIILLLFSVFTGVYIYGEDYLGWLVGIGLWAVMNVINSIYILAFRADGNIGSIASYYARTSISGMVLFIATALNYYFFIQTDAYKVEVLLFSIIVPELYYFLKNILSSSYVFDFRHDIKVEVYFKKFILTRQSGLTVMILFLVVGIDITDKIFTTLGGSSGNGASILIYGSLLPLVLRNSLDVKSLFYTSLQECITIKEQLVLLSSVHKKIMKIYVPVIIFLALFVFLFGKYALLMMKIDEDSALAIMKVFSIYCLLIPFYIYWDLFYRMFHWNNKVVHAVVLVLGGVIVNIILNYIFVIELFLGAFGIALSTFFVFFMYTVISSMYFSVQGRLGNV